MQLKWQPSLLLRGILYLCATDWSMTSPRYVRTYARVHAILNHVCGSMMNVKMEIKKRNLTKKMLD